MRPCSRPAWAVARPGFGRVDPVLERRAPSALPWYAPSTLMLQVPAGRGRLDRTASIVASDPVVLNRHGGRPKRCFRCSAAMTESSVGRAKCSPAPRACPRPRPPSRCVADDRDAVAVVVRRTRSRRRPGLRALAPLAVERVGVERVPGARHTASERPPRSLGEGKGARPALGEQRDLLLRQLLDPGPRRCTVSSPPRSDGRSIGRAGGGG